jgi:RNA-directed DNA polymerase
MDGESKMSRRLLPDRQGGQVRAINLVAPLANQATEKCLKEDDGGDTRRARSGAVSPLIGESLRRGDVDSAISRSTHPTAITPGTRTSTTATRTTGTRTTSSALVLSANGSDARPADLLFSDLVAAYFDCREHKRNSLTALAFESDLERNLTALFDELVAGTYQPGPSICFVITRPKPREVWAAAFRDRIVHHLLYNRISGRFYASFIADSCACIPGRGTLYAAERLEAKVRSITQNWSRPASYLKCDLANFFVSIDKRICRELLHKKVEAGWWRDLADLVLLHDPRTNYVLQGSPQRLARIPPHKSLFSQDEHHGLPIGNLSSQFFANVYLDVLDQWVKHVVGARRYVRYVDDFVLLHESPQWLNRAREGIEELLEERLGMRLNPRKTILQPIERGIDFVGQVQLPWRRVIRRRTVNLGLRRLAHIHPDRFFETANSYLGLLGQATHSHGDRARYGRVALQRGHCVEYALTKIHRRAL